MIEKGKVKDVELIKMVKQERRERNRAIECILSTESAKIQNYLMKQNCSKEDAEDVLYEGLSVFILNVRSGKFQGESSISTYLVGICKRIWFKKFNRMLLHKKWEEIELMDSKHIKDVGEDKGSIITKELVEGLEILMAGLKDKCKKILQLWSLSYSMEEIKNKVGYNSTQAVRNKKNLCLKQLRKQLADNPKLAKLIT